jgi:two-component system, NarL family, nitrate/nitrite response regulator NarL
LLGVRIAVLSDDRLFADGLVRIVQADDGIAVASASEGRNGLLTALSHNPHILIIDSRLTNATDLCARASGALRRKTSGPSVVFVAAPEDDNWAIDALIAGARGILGKRAAPGDLHKALRVVVEGQIWSSRRILAASLERLIAPASPAPRAVAADLHSLLSDREREVFPLAATGMGNKELAGALSISEATVKVHLTRIFQKLGLRGRGELAAAYHGLLPRRAADSVRPRLSKSA